jgi:hypothetical protein
MDAIGSLSASATPTAQAVQAAQANTTTGTTDAQKEAAGLPPVLLAAAASKNTVNAQLVASQWGLDPSTVSGVYGGAGADGGLFSGDSLLPLLTSISHATAEQALALIGITTPKPAATAATTAGAASASTAAATSTQGQAALDQAAQSSSSPMVVDPLWGKSA